MTGTHKELVEALKYTSKELLQVISSFQQQKLNVLPFAGSWTAAQVAEHVLKSGKGVLEVLQGTVTITERQADKKKEELKKVFLDVTTAYKSPPEVVPSDHPQEKEKLLTSLENTLEGLSNAAHTLDLSATCLDAELPGSGSMTRLEWLYFFIYHTQRHIYQLKNIFKKLAVRNGTVINRP